MGRKGGARDQRRPFSFRRGSAVIELCSHSKQTLASDAIRLTAAASDQASFAQSVEHREAAIGKAEAFAIEAVDVEHLASFVALSASLEGPKNGKKRAQVYPEHPSTRGMGAEADDLPSLRFDKQPHRR